jgi:hypothetical protein
MRSSASKHASIRVSKPASGFQRYDRCRFAVVLSSLRGGTPLMGRAHFQRDDLLGNVLRIAVERASAGGTDIIIAENEWNGLITPGTSYGCDYCLSLIPEASEKSR